MQRLQQQLLGEIADVREELRGLLENADEWLDAPNSRFGGDKPRDLIGTPREQELRDLVRAAKYGVYE